MEAWHQSQCSANSNPKTGSQPTCLLKQEFTKNVLSNTAYTIVLLIAKQLKHK